MSKIPTAFKILESKFNEPFGEEWVYDNIQEAMIEFAKMHVKAALKEAYNNVELEDIIYTGCHECFRCDKEIDRDSIFNAYPEENIQ